MSERGPAGENQSAPHRPLLTVSWKSDRAATNRPGNVARLQGSIAILTRGCVRLFLSGGFMYLFRQHARISALSSLADSPRSSLARFSPLAAPRFGDTSSLAVDGVSFRILAFDRVLGPVSVGVTISAQISARLFVCSLARLTRWNMTDLVRPPRNRSLVGIEVLLL